MKEKIIKNKNKILIILAFILSLSGVVVFADVTSNNDTNTVSDNEAQILKASFLSKDNQDSETEIETNKQMSGLTQEVIDEAPNTEEESAELEVSDKDRDLTKFEVLAHEETTLKEIKTEKEKAYQEEVASIDKKVVPLKYNNIDFGSIGTVSSKDVQIGISTANNFVNIRETASEEGKVLGKLYANEAAAILSLENEWALVESGNAKGYVTTDYLNMDLTKDEVIEATGNLKATITVNGLNVRKEANEEAEVLTVIYENEKYTVLDTSNDWVKISIPKDGIVGYVSNEYSNLSVSFEQAITIEEEQEILRKEKEEAERKAAEEETARKAAAKKKADKEAAKKAKAKSNKSSSKPKAAASNSASSGNNNSSSEHSAKEEIARRESGGNYNARNGKYIGRYQLNKSYLGGDHSPENQERVAENYVAKRYGSWQNALKFWNANGWY